MALRLRLPGGRWTVGTLVVLALVGSVALWHSYGLIEHYRKQAAQIAELRRINAKVATKPANVAEFWRKLPGVDPNIFEEVTEVTYPQSMVVSDYSLRSLKGMTELTRVELLNSTVSAESAKFLQSLSKLESLELNSSKMTDADVQAISQKPTLKHLTLRGNEIGNKSVKAIASLPNLEALTLFGGRIDDAGLASLAQMPTLKFLALSGTFSDEGLEKLRGCKQLQTLELFALGATDRTLRALKSLPDLQTLMIAEGAYTDDAVLDLKNSPQMKHFSCTGASIAATPKKWEMLSSKPFSVTPSFDEPDPERFYELGGFVEEINMVVGSEWTGEDWDIAHGAAFKDVTDVNIVSARVHDRGIARLVRFGRKLQSLTIGDAAITPAVTDYLARMPVQWLSLAGAKIDDSWVPALSQLTNVKRLELVNTQVSPDGLEKLKAAGVKVIVRSKKQSVSQDTE